MGNVTYYILSKNITAQIIKVFTGATNQQRARYLAAIKLWNIIKLAFSVSTKPSQGAIFRKQ